MRRKGSPFRGACSRGSGARKDNRVVGRIEIEADHVDYLLAEAWVVADLERFDAMRPQIGCLPYLLDLPACYARVLCHQREAPMRRFTRDAVGRPIEDLLRLFRRHLPRLARPRQILEAGEPLSTVARTPLVDGEPHHTELGRDRLVAQPLCAEQDDPRALG